MNIKLNDLENITVEGICPNDYPRFTDAFIASATWKDNGDELCEQQLDWVNDNYKSEINLLAYESLL